MQVFSHATMNTSDVPKSLPSVKLEPSNLANGEGRLLGTSTEYHVEIIPDKSVAFFLNGISKEVFYAVAPLIGSTEDALSLLAKAAFFVAANPNEPFHAQLPRHLELTLTKVVHADSQTLLLSVADAPATT